MRAAARAAEKVASRTRCEFYGARESPAAAAAARRVPLLVRTDLGWDYVARTARSRNARIGVELFASPYQRLRGCRHLQPSTGCDGRRAARQMPARTRDPRWRVQFRISNAACFTAVAAATAAAVD